MQDKESKAPFLASLFKGCLELGASVNLNRSYLEGHPLLDSVQEARCQGCCGPSVDFHHIPAGNHVSGGEVFEHYAGKRPHVQSVYLD